MKKLSYYAFQLEMTGRHVVLNHLLVNLQNLCLQWPTQYKYLINCCDLCSHYEKLHQVGLLFSLVIPKIIFVWFVFFVWATVVSSAIDRAASKLSLFYNLGNLDLDLWTLSMSYPFICNAHTLVPPTNSNVKHDIPCIWTHRNAQRLEWIQNLVLSDPGRNDCEWPKLDGAWKKLDLVPTPIHYNDQWITSVSICHLQQQLLGT